MKAGTIRGETAETIIHKIDLANPELETLAFAQATNKAIYLTLPHMKVT